MTAPSPELRDRRLDADALAALIAWLRKRGEPNSGIRYESNIRGHAYVELTGTDATFVAKHFHGQGARELADALNALASPPVSGAEPVAWRYYDDYERGWDYDEVAHTDWQALYAHPAAPPEPGQDQVEAWMGYWPGAGSIDSYTKTTHIAHVAERWKLDGAEVTPLGRLRPRSTNPKTGTGVTDAMVDRALVAFYGEGAPPFDDWQRDNMRAALKSTLSPQVKQ